MKVCSLLLGLALWALSAVAQTTMPLADHPFVRDLCGGDPALLKISGDLLLARQAVAQGATPLTAAQRHVRHALRRGGDIQVLIGVEALTAEVLDAVAKAGLTIVSTHEQGDLRVITARCRDPRQLDAVARLRGTRGIASEGHPHLLVGAAPNQADASIHANSARSTFGVDGSGVRVGVLSDSIFDVRNGGVAAPSTFPANVSGTTDQVSGDLPDPLYVVDPWTQGTWGGDGSGGAGTDEGNAMAQLIYDLAPGCDISFASAFSGYMEFANNITALRTDATAPADVIVDDVIYFEEPMYQDGPIALAASAAVAAGVPYFSSAGNEADDGHERTYTDVNPGSDDAAVPPSGVDLHDFGAAMGMASDTHLSLQLSPGDEVILVLHWDEPYGGVFGAGPGAEANLDLYLTSDTALPLQDANPTPGQVGPGDNVLGKSVTVQGTMGSPQGDALEALQFENTSGSTLTAHVVVDHLAGRDPVTLHLLVLLQGFGSITDKAYLADRTVYGHAAGQGAVGVGAVFYAEIDFNGAVDAPPGQIDVESFSSLGGQLPIWFPPAGAPRLGVAETRLKPEIAAPDGTNTTFFGFDIDGDTHPNFFGTSAAAPHAAAVAALMLERAADLGIAVTAVEIQNLMRATARDIEAAGTDFWAGDGLIDAFDAVDGVSTLMPTAAEAWTLYR